MARKPVLGKFYLKDIAGPMGVSVSHIRKVCFLRDDIKLRGGFSEQDDWDGAKSWVNWPAVRQLTTRFCKEHDTMDKRQEILDRIWFVSKGEDVSTRNRRRTLMAATSTKKRKLRYQIGKDEQGGKCNKCECELDFSIKHNGSVTSNGATLDHIDPICVGGARWERTNLQVLCRSCHEAKTSQEQRVMHEARRARYIEEKFPFMHKSIQENGLRTMFECGEASCHRIEDGQNLFWSVRKETFLCHQCWVENKPHRDMDMKLSLEVMYEHLFFHEGHLHTNQQ